jgi:hypothetical protein
VDHDKDPIWMPPEPPEVVAAWQARLETIAPRSDGAGWLLVYWEPGEEWWAVNRWIIANMVPKALLYKQAKFYESVEGKDAAQNELFYELEGPSPREGAHYDEILGKLVHSEDRLPPSITQRQWLLWREHDAFAIPVWVVQGAEGGHKRSFNRVEELILKRAGKPHVAPFPGELPYSVPTEKTYEMIQRMKTIKEKLIGRDLSFVGDQTEWARMKAALDQEFNTELLNWLEEMIGDVYTQPMHRAKIA